MQYGMSCIKQIQPVLTFMYSRGFGIGSPITDIQALKGVSQLWDTLYRVFESFEDNAAQE